MATISGNGTERRINVLDATIKTATVEIKTLTISGKQVTLAVFRQLQQATCWDMYDEGNRHTVLTVGTPWGRVNYCPDECRKSNDEHIHVIWQDNNTLLRDTVYRWAAKQRIWEEGRRRFYTNTPVEAWNEFYQHLLRLDQLFIAV
jgi:hypothetical protein